MLGFMLFSPEKLTSQTPLRPPARGGVRLISETKFASIRSKLLSQCSTKGGYAATSHRWIKSWHPAQNHRRICLEIASHKASRDAKHDDLIYSFK
jgi:hypothetical protein